jgi:hypothetical protein
VNRAHPCRWLVRRNIAAKKRTSQKTREEIVGFEI